MLRVVRLVEALQCPQGVYGAAAEVPLVWIHVSLAAAPSVSLVSGESLLAVPLVYLAPDVMVFVIAAYDRMKYQSLKSL